MGQQPSIQQQSHQQGQINNQQTNFHQDVLQPEAQPPHSFSSPQDYQNSYQSNSYSADHNSYSSQPDPNSHQASSPGVLTSGNDYGLDNHGSSSQTYQGGFSDQYGFD